MIIDGHSHVTLPIKNHIETMNAAKVDKTVLFSTTFHPETAHNFNEVKTSMEFLNDLLAGKKGSMIEARQKSISELVEAIKLFPNRYIGFGNVPVGLELNATLQYVDNYIYKNHLSGMGEFTLASGQVHLLNNIFIASEEFENLPIWIHAFYPLTISDIKEISKFAKSFPKTPVILGHLGGTNWIETVALVKEISNLYLDTSAYFSTLVLSNIINEIPQKCLFGVDGPFGDLQLSIDTIIKFAKTSSIASEVLGENISKLLKI